MIPKIIKRKWGDGLVNIISGKNQKQVLIPNGPYPIYGSGGIIGQSKEALAPAGSTIVGRKGTINRPIFVEQPFWNVDTAFALAPSHDLLPKYLFYFCLGFNFSRLDNSTTIPSLAKSVLLEIEMPVPEREEQRRIVERIEELFSGIDKAEEELREAEHNIFLFRQTTLHSSFAKADNSEYLLLGDILEEIDSGKSFKCIESPPQQGECGIVKVSAVTWGTYNEEESKTCSPNKFISKSQIHEGDFLFSRANTLQLIGACTIVHEVKKKLMLSDKILRFKFSESAYPIYILHFLRSRDGRKQIEEFSSGNQESMRNIGREKIKKIRIPLPSKKKQIAISQEIEVMNKQCEQIERLLNQSKKNLSLLRQSILKKAFAGKLV